ncbi:MAG: hypothetical protein DRG78_04795 [Epsilonproteobacteria bacterium]|nr:MAG: hypothetical protein DRG78_04795 [Campylobacterota bacterium]
MIATTNLKEIRKIIEKYKDIEYRIINNTIGKNLILLKLKNENLMAELKDYDKYIQEIIFESDENEDKLFIKEIKSICKSNSISHRNISYINWNRKPTVEKINNVISGYSFKGGMGRSSTLAYLSYFFYLLGKKIVVLDCDFEAPGIASMFFEREKRETKAGVLDYLIDLNIENEPKLDNYFIQSEVSDNSGNLYLFPSGIDFDIENYINKISKIDFNSQGYSNNFSKLLKHINKTLKPDMIFIDLRAGINESNGLVLKGISDTNLLFFNSEEQNEDGLKVILNLLDNLDNSFIMNSTIRYFDSEVRENKEKKLNNFLIEEFNLNKEYIQKLGKDNEKVNIPHNAISVPYKSEMLENNNINEFKNFIKDQYEIYKTNGSIYLKELLSIINLKYIPKSDTSNLSIAVEDTIDLEYILKKLENVFSHLTGTKKFEKLDDLKYFYLKDDISKIVNEQIFLILGAKGSGKSTLFEVFTKHHQDILSKLNIKNNSYIAGFSRDIMKDITHDYITMIYNNSNKKPIDIERFWKCLTLLQVEEELGIKDKFFKNIEEVSQKFIDVNIGLEADKRLKQINIELLQDDKIITLVYDELDIGFTEETSIILITALVSFWQNNIYKYSQIRSKVLLRNDIFKTLNIENKTHLDLNKYELKWNEKEILSLILKIFIAALTTEELDIINLSNIIKRKNDKVNEVVDNLEEIREAIYLIFDKRVALNRHTMDKWIMTRLSDAKGLITPRVVYKFMLESIKQELSLSIRPTKSHLLTSFKKYSNEILKKVGEHKIDEYNAEYKTYNIIYSKLNKIGQRNFSYDEFKKEYIGKTSDKKILGDLNKLINSGFIGENGKQYQVPYIYLFGLNLKQNRSNTKQEDD